MQRIFSFGSVSALALLGSTAACTADVRDRDTEINSQSVSAESSESALRTRAPLAQFWTTYGRHVIYEAGDVAAATSVEFIKPGVQELQLSRGVGNEGSAFSVIARDETPNRFPRFAINTIPADELTAAKLANRTGTFTVFNGAGRRILGSEIEYALQPDGTLLVKQLGITVRLYPTISRLPAELPRCSLSTIAGGTCGGG